MFLFIALFMTSSIAAREPLFLNKQEAIEKGATVQQVTEAWRYTPGQFPLQTVPEWFCKIPGAYVAELEDASLFGQHGIVIVKNKIYQDSLWIWSPLYLAPNDLFPLTTVQEVNGTVATIALDGASNYYHWMVEILPRLYLLKQAGIEYDYLYTPALRHRFQTNTLEYLGVDLTRTIEAGKEKHIKPTKVIFPSQAARSCVTPRWVIDFLRSAFLGDYQPHHGKKRIFISRTSSAIRHIINEDELFSVVEPFGFERVYMEKLTIQEQAQLAHECEIIMGTHGAGMTNIIFARSGTTIIELFQEHLYDCFFEISQTMGFKHHCIKTERIPELSQEDVDIRFRNTFVNVATFKKNITPILEQLSD